MKTIRLDIDYQKRILAGAGENGVPGTAEQVSLAVIIAGVNPSDPGHQRQMSIAQLRMWSRIQDRILDDDGKPVAGDVELTPEQFDFLYEKVTQTPYPPGFAGATTAFADYLETVKLEKKE